MTQYFFLASMLPPLNLEAQPELGFGELMILFQDNLLPGDYKQTEILRRYYDILNLRALWKGEDFDPHGNLDRNQLEEAMLNYERLPKYILRFLDSYQKTEERILNFGSLLAAYFREEVKESDSFLKTYLDFERKLRLVLVAFRAKKMGRNLAKELQFEDPEEILIAQILAQRDAPMFEPPEEFAFLKSLFEENGDHPYQLYKALTRYRFDKIDEIEGIGVFSFRKILGYMAQLIIVEQWQQLDKKKGLEIVDDILRQSSQRM